MQIIIPMSGEGMRFKEKGYVTLKPLIQINGKPMISYVIDMFPGEKNIIFVCNKEHLLCSKLKMQRILKDICPSGRILSINPHKKGPVYAISQVFDEIQANEPTIVNYCDFCCLWDYKKFKEKILKGGYKGAVPAYRNFHPHSLNKNYYAYIKNIKNKILKIQEKKPFTKYPINEYASSGTYYFSNADLIKNYFTEIIKKNIHFDNEFYVSEVFNLMIEDKLDVILYKLNYFMQWGTPEDLEEFSYWSKIFKNLIKENKGKNHLIKGINIIPMAGSGTRFYNAGYKNPKPMIDVSGEMMVLKASRMLPNSNEISFIHRIKQKKINECKKKIKENFKFANFFSIKKKTQGQAITCLKLIEKLNDNDLITIGACDNGVIFDMKKYKRLLNDDSIDIIVWGKKNHPNAIKKPNDFGWIISRNEKIDSILVKRMNKDPKNIPIVIGTFTFKKSLYFKRSVNQMIKRKGTINNEYYIDEAINDSISLGYQCAYFEVDSYIGWGTPNDLKTFNYWQKCFDAWSSHPYQKTKDKYLCE